MRILLGTTGFAHPGGSETYLLTMAQQLERLGHDVVICAAELGAVAAAAEEAGLRVVGSVDEVGAAPAATLAQDAPTAYELAGRWPSAPLVFRACSDVYDFQLPPEVPGVAVCVVACTDRVADRVRATAATHEIVRLRHPVDVRRFQPLRPIRERPRRALILGNYLDGPRLEALTGAWEAAGVECLRLGRPAAATLAPEIAMNDADIVVGKARVIIEAMACGRAAYVYDYAGRDGWVTAGNYAALEADNFAGMATGLGVDPAGLAADLPAYDAAMGDVNRDLAVRHHHAGRHADALVALFRRLGAGEVAPAGDAPASNGAASAAPRLGELARLGRRQWASEREAMNLRRELGRVTDERDAARTAYEDAHAALTGARDDALAAYDTAAAERDLFRDDRDAWQARALLAEQEAERLRGLLETRRVRAAMAGGKLADRMRGR